MKAKLLLLITNLGKGGAQRVFYDHALALKENYPVIEAVFDKNEDNRIYDSGLPLYSLDVTAGNTPLEKVANLFRRGRRLREIIKKEKVTLTISHMDGANWVNVLSGTSEKKILVVHGTVLHDHNQNRLIQVFRKIFLLPYLYNKAAVTVAVSDGIRYELEKMCRVKNAVSIPNFFDVPAIQRAAAQPVPDLYAPLFTQHPVLITSGRLAEQKKQKSLIPVFKGIKQNYREARLVLLGDGELRNEIMQEVIASGLTLYTVWGDQPFSTQYDVYMFGYVNNPFSFLSKSRLFLFPSGWEGFPMALCEAMISGVPVLSADCPTGPRQILAPETFDTTYSLDQPQVTDYGVLMPMADKINFQEVWIQTSLVLLQDQQASNRLVKNAWERMQAFDKPVVIQKWLGLIDTVLNGFKEVKKPFLTEK